MNIRARMCLLIFLCFVVGVGVDECPPRLPSFDGTYTGKIKTGPETTCNLTLSIQQKQGRPITATLNCIDPLTLNPVIVMNVTDGVRVLHELTFLYQEQLPGDPTSGICSMIRIKGWPEKYNPPQQYYDGIVGAIDLCSRNAQAGIESVCIPYMGLSAEMVAKGEPEGEGEQ